MFSIITYFSVFITLSLLVVTLSEASNLYDETINSAECLIESDGSLTSCQQRNNTFSSETKSIYFDEVDGSSAESSFSEDISSPAPEESDLTYLGQDIGEPQKVIESLAKEILEKVGDDQSYIENVILVDEKYKNVRDTCKNKHEMCTYWSLLGECDKNEAYMKVNCGPACHSCERLDFNLRCPMDPNAVDAFYPGDVNKMFERIAYGEEYKQFEPIVMSRPPEGPWLIMFENAISDEEAERLIELGDGLGFERSTTVGTKQADGTYDKKVIKTRTSSNAWCFKECMEDELAQRVVQRIENITGIPERNSENLQLLRYENGQYYNTHR
jgi:prolyl 4-hydroxylase